MVMVKTIYASALSMSILSASTLASADITQVENELQSFAVKTGATRLIYLTDSNGASMTVTNPQSYPMLVQSEVLGEDRKSKAAFIVTPPLFRLDGHQQSRIKVVATSSHNNDLTESLHWLCLTGIPPEPESDWTGEEYKKSHGSHRATILTQLRIKSCLKLLIRPASLRGTPDDFASSLKWTIAGKTLTVKNPTPFYMNLRNIQLGELHLPTSDYVPPMGKLELSVPAGTHGPVHWRLLTDYGGDSREFISELH